MKGKWKDFKSIFFTTVIKHTQFTFKIDYKFSCPIWIAGPNTNVCMVCVCVRERDRDRDRLLHDQRFLSIFDLNVS